MQDTSRKSTADKAEVIMEAALALMNERGFDGTPVPMIAERAGVAAGTIYRYFPSKRELGNQLFRRWKTRFRDLLREGFPHDGPPREQFRVLWKRLRDFARTHPEAYMFLETHHHGPYLDAASKAVEDEVMDFLRGLFEAAQSCGAVRSLDPQLLISLVFGTFTRIVKDDRTGRLEAGEGVFLSAEACCWDAVKK